ncbi:hypothetical protein NDU88_007718 [Pleurodeles waltl]|uniref:Uncharacterized protein n=1 Tax=Pleurodeles waltl TaxID=8319 RepID=A0AAV7U0H8_PLEWA|nr:hypothetical protein NDU88_007718 [Pleurodeles waltl]
MRTPGCAQEEQLEQVAPHLLAQPASLQRRPSMPVSQPGAPAALKRPQYESDSLKRLARAPLPGRPCRQPSPRGEQAPLNPGAKMPRSDPTADRASREIVTAPFPAPVSLRGALPRPPRTPYERRRARAAVCSPASQAHPGGRKLSAKRPRKSRPWDPADTRRSQECTRGV